MVFLLLLYNSSMDPFYGSQRPGLGKLNFLLSQQPSPPETFVNLLLLYCKYSYYDLAADILAENAELRPGFKSQSALKTFVFMCF